MSAEPEQDEGQAPEPESALPPNKGGRRALKIVLIILIGIPALLLALALLVLGACFIGSL
jgi:hypothetical protein